MENTKPNMTYIHVKKGRPTVNNVKEDKEYFKKYYHLTKADFTCECGMTMNNHSKNKHLKTQTHKRVIEKLELVKELNLLRN